MLVNDMMLVVAGSNLSRILVRQWSDKVLIVHGD